MTKSWENQDNQQVQRLCWKCPPFARTQALKSFAPLINNHVNSRLFKPAPNFNQPLLQFVDGVDFPLVYMTHSVIQRSKITQSDLKSWSKIKRSKITTNTAFNIGKSWKSLGFPTATTINKRHEPSDVAIQTSRCRCQPGPLKWRKQRQRCQTCQAYVEMHAFCAFCYISAKLGKFTHLSN